MIKLLEFSKRRSMVLAKAEARDAVRAILRAKYGPGMLPSWLKAGERARLERADAAYDKACDRMFKLLDASPRDWRAGVPAYWAAEKLSYADATRPASMPLSVEPPKAYGY